MISGYVGRGFNQNVTEGVKWMRLAAEKNEPAAQFWLGRAYSGGGKNGVVRDYVEAFKWLTLAALSESTWLKQAVTVRDALAKKLTPSQLAEAQKRASDLIKTFEQHK